MFVTGLSSGNLLPCKVTNLVAFGGMLSGKFSLLPGVVQAGFLISVYNSNNGNCILFVRAGGGGGGWSLLFC